MRFQTLLSGLVLGISFTCSAIAAPVFLVQLGSHASKDESIQQWQKLSTEYAEKLAGMDFQSSEVILPPAGRKVYRLQAGPLPSRLDAISLCGTMHEAGNDCFVVESATFTPETSYVAPIANASGENDMNKNPGNASDESTLASLFDFSSDASDGAQLAAMAPAAMPATLPDTTTAEVAANTAIELAQNTTTAVSKAVNQAESLAISGQESTQKDSYYMPWDRGFWTSDEAEDAQEIAAVAQEENTSAMYMAQAEQEPTPVVAPAAAMAARDTAPNVPEYIEDQDSARAVSAVPAFIEERQQAQAERAPQPIMGVVPPRRPEVYPLPRATSQAEANAVKARLRQAATKELERQTPPPKRTAATQARGTIVNDQYRPAALPALRAPRQVAAAQPIQQPRMVAVNAAPARPAMPSGSAQVEVAEAIPVPLSEAPQAIVSPENEEYVFLGRRARAWGASPSRNFAQKTVWAKIQYFASKRAAMEFWNQLRAQYPQTTYQLRARITKPYTRHEATEKVSLQLGPFLKSSDVGVVCNLVKESPVTCGLARDMGSDSAANTPRYRPDDRGYATMRNNATSQSPRAARGTNYWVQLGAYPTKAAAYQAWNRLKAKHPYSLESRVANVTRPLHSSSTRATYRLRTGPFSIRAGAEQLCQGIKNGQSGCVVVSE